MEIERPLKQKTVDLHTDQLEEIKRLAKLSNMKETVVLRKALDAGLGLPKKQEGNKDGN